MTIFTKDRGPLDAKSIIFLNGCSHDFIVEWENGGCEHMRNSEIKAIMA